MYNQRLKIAGMMMLWLCTACTEILEPVQLDGVSIAEGQQEEFTIELQPMTFAAARKLNSDPFERMISAPGVGDSAGVFSERKFIKSSYPPNPGKQPYKLGAGDEVALTLMPSPFLNGRVSGNLNFNDRSIDLGSPYTSMEIIPGRIEVDGGLWLAGAGVIDALGRSIAEIRNEVKQILIRNGEDPNFHLEIKAFKSQKAFVTTYGELNSANENKVNSIIPITEHGITLREVIASHGLSFSDTKLTLISLKRHGDTYRMSLSDVFSVGAPEIYLQDKDHIWVQSFDYHPGKAFVLGGVNPSIIPLKPEEKQTLADALFTKGGPLETLTAQRSAVYLLRGDNPVKAYHLDAQNPVRVLVADAIELRPNDIIFVAEQPIVSFNRTIAALLPLRSILSDIRTGDLP